jgi:hypothetical protein
MSEGNWQNALGAGEFPPNPLWGLTVLYIRRQRSVNTLASITLSWNYASLWGCFGIGQRLGCPAARPALQPEYPDIAVERMPSHIDTQDNLLGDG